LVYVEVMIIEDQAREMYGEAAKARGLLLCYQSLALPKHCWHM